MNAGVPHWYPQSVALPGRFRPLRAIRRALWRSVCELSIPVPAGGLCIRTSLSTHVRDARGVGYNRGAKSIFHYVSALNANSKRMPRRHANIRYRAEHFGKALQHLHYLSEHIAAPDTASSIVVISRPASCDGIRRRPQCARRVSSRDGLASCAVACVGLG